MGSSDTQKDKQKQKAQAKKVNSRKAEGEYQLQSASKEELRQALGCSGKIGGKTHSGEEVQQQLLVQCLSRWRRTRHIDDIGNRTRHDSGLRKHHLRRHRRFRGGQELIENQRDCSSENEELFQGHLRTSQGAPFIWSSRNRKDNVGKSHQ